MKGKNKKVAIILLFLIFLGVISPLQSVLSQGNQVVRAVEPDIPGIIVQGVLFGLFPGFFPALGAMQQLSKCNPLNLTDCIIRAIASWAGTIATLFLNLSHALLNWVISDKFIGVSMTGPDNVIVNYGWTMMRNLANIILVLGLVVIGLGIILGLEEYKAKKTLPILIAIAILINFTPVICGFVIDFSNILMSYFLTGGLSNSLTVIVEEGISRIPDDNAINALGITSVYLVFGIVGAIAFTLYAFLFAARYLFLWIFIMFSPIAFVSRVFPQSKYIKHFFPEFFYWDTWWEKFLQWCVIGIYGGLFIYLANQLMGGLVTSQPSGALSPFGILFGYLLPILLLLIGLFSAWEAWQKGLNAIPGMKQVVDLGTKAAMVAATAGAGAIAAGAGLAAGAAAGAAQGVAAGEGWRAIAGRALTAGGREKGMTAVRRRIEGMPGIGRLIGGPGAATRAEQEELDKAEKEVKAISKTPQGKEDLIRLTEMREVTKADHYRKIKAIQELADRKSLPDEVVERTAPAYQRSGQDIDIILRADPAFARHFTNVDTHQPMTTQEAVNRFTGRDLARYLQRTAIDAQGRTPAEITRIETTVLAVAANQQNFNAMRGLPRDLKLAFADSLRYAAGGRPFVPPEIHNRVAQTVTDPRWQ